MESKAIDRAGWVRIALYIVTTILAIVGLVASEMGRTDLTEIVQQISLTLAAVFGVTASVNVPKAPDQSAVKPRDIQGEIHEVVESVREIREATRPVVDAAGPFLDDLSARFNIPPFSSYKEDPRGTI